MVRLCDRGARVVDGVTRQDVEDALYTLESCGLVEVPLDAIDGPVAAWLDELIGRAEESGLTVTWMTRDQLLCVVDMEA